jgi:phosphoglycerol transferase
MFKKLLRNDAGLSRNYLIIGLAILLIFLLYRNLGLYPVIFPDELVSSSLSRLLPFSYSLLPNYLFLSIYRVTNLCGDRFLDCARILNSLFFVAAAPFIYLAARRVCTSNVAAIITLFSSFGPINIYTAYFIAESLLFFSFWVLTWFILRLNNKSTLISWCVGGILLGFTTLVKARSLLLLPAVVAYILFVSRNKEAPWIAIAFKRASAFVVFTFLTIFLISHLMVEKSGLVVVANSYGNVLSPITAIPASVPAATKRLLDLVALTAESLKGHVLAMCLIFGLPMILATRSCVISFCEKDEPDSNQKIAFFALVTLVTLILAACLFTVLMSGTSPLETITRLHMRYYNYAFPLLLMAAGSRLSSDPAATKPGWKVIFALPVGAAILYALTTRLSPYIPSYIDNPEFRTFAANRITFYTLGILSLSSLIVWIFRARTGAKIFLYFLMPILLLSSTVHEYSFAMQRREPDAYDNAAIYIKQHLPNETKAKFVIIGSGPEAVMERMLFYLDNPEAWFEIVPKGSSYDLSRLPADTECVLVLGDHELTKNSHYNPQWVNEPTLKAAGLRLFSLRH